MISGQETIQVGVENQSTGADNIFDAFQKTQNNFSKLFNSSSPYVNFNSGPGIDTTKSGNTVTITNTGVRSISPGTGIEILDTDGAVLISATGTGQLGVTNVGVSSSTLNVTNSPIISSGIITIDLPIVPLSESFAPGEYYSPSLTIDSYGRIVGIANGTSIGTVTSVAVQAVGNGITITGGSPITSSGTILIKNTGVTKLTAGPGIALSGTTGDLTISSSITVQGTVTRVDITSSTLDVTNSPVTRAGTINIEIPNDIVLNGLMASNTLLVTSTANVYGNINLANTAVTGIITVTGNANVGNVNTVNVSASGNTVSANVIGNVKVTAPSITTAGNISSSAWGVTGLGFIATGATYTDSSTAASGTVANAHIHVVSRPTVAASNTSVTVTKSASWYISGAPIAGTNVTITNPYALQIGNGNVQVDTTTTSTSTTTGALRVVGGVGIGENLNVGGIANVTGNLNITGNVSSNILSVTTLLRTVDTGLSATGTTQGTALTLTKHLNIISASGSGANGVVLPTPVAGQTIKIVNLGSNPLNIYPASSGKINALSTDAPLNITANTRVELISANATQWYSFP